MTRREIDQKAAIMIVIEQLGSIPPGTKCSAVFFDAQRIGGAVEHANSVCLHYGVRIVSINVISACPADKRLMEALSAGAVAAAEAEQAKRDLAVALASGVSNNCFNRALRVFTRTDFQTCVQLLVAGS